MVSENERAQENSKDFPIIFQAFGQMTATMRAKARAAIDVDDVAWAVARLASLKITPHRLAS